MNVSLDDRLYWRLVTVAEREGVRVTQIVEDLARDRYGVAPEDRIGFTDDDRRNLRRYFELGLNDRELGLLLGYTHNTVRRLRGDMGLLRQSSRVGLS